MTEARREIVELWQPADEAAHFYFLALRGCPGDTSGRIFRCGSGSLSGNEQ